MRCPAAASTFVNPSWLDRESYRGFLNVGFRGQWDRAAFRWYVSRGLDSSQNDLIVRAAGERVLAGVTLCYRHVAIGKGVPIQVCVASAGTTLPSERRRGHYAALLQAAIERARARGCAALLGFVTRHNGSGQGLLQIGASRRESFYISSSVSSSSFRRGTSCRPTGARLPALALARVAQQGRCPDRAQFHYSSADEWISQFVDRPYPVTAVRLAHDSVALIESVPASGGKGLRAARRPTDRLQWLSCPRHKQTAHLARLAASTVARKRNFFAYSLDPLLADAARRAGLRVRPGFLMMLPLAGREMGWNDLAGAAWCVQSGDRL